MRPHLHPGQTNPACRCAMTPDDLAAQFAAVSEKRIPQPLIPVRLTESEIAIICGALARTKTGSLLSGRLAARVVEFKTEKKKS